MHALLIWHEAIGSTKLISVTPVEVEPATKAFGSRSQRGYHVGEEAAANVQIVVVVMCNYHRSFHGTLGKIFDL